MALPEVIRGTVLSTALIGTLPAWQPGYPAGTRPMATSGFAVDTADRDDAVAFWHAVHAASEGFQFRVGWNGQFPNNPGSTSKVFVGDVERRINYFRAICGVPSDTRVNTGSRLIIRKEDRFKPSPAITKEAAAQEMAMLITANYDSSNGQLSGMTHDPDPELSLWSASAWNAAANGNLVFGAFGPDAITAYVTEETQSSDQSSSWNSEVGHRRWVLLPQATNFATGDFPGESSERPPANVLYVIQSTDELRPSAPNPFVSYPPKGYFPVDLNGRFWSLSRQDTDFSQARVTIRDANGNRIKVSNVKVDSSYGNPTLVWQADAPAAIRSTINDKRLQVEVRGIVTDEGTVSHSYEVILINPRLLRTKPPIKGSRKLRAGARQKYMINRLAGARSSRIVQYQRHRRTWSENGDGGKVAVIDRTSSNYPLLAKVVGEPGRRAISGTNSFNLTFPFAYDPLVGGVPAQSFELDTWFQTKNRSVLSFQYIRGIMSPDSVMAVEVSTDQGSSWQRLGELIPGKAQPTPDQAISSASYPLPRSTKPLRVRFRYFFNAISGSIAIHGSSGGFPTGIFIDDIQVTKSDWYERLRAKPLKGNVFRFKPRGRSKPGDRWALALESEFGGDWMQTGPFRNIRLQKK